MDHTAADLQAQVDELTAALRQWRETHDRAEPMEQRLQELTDRCAEILTRWQLTSERHARAVADVESRLQHWTQIESRLEQDSVQRLGELSEVVRREWAELRRIHEEPVKQLRDQAAALGETCMAAASLAVRGFERTEARLSVLETDLHARLNQLSRDIQTALVPAAPKPAGIAPFPLDSVMRIHDELRQESSSGATPEIAAPGGAAGAAESRLLLDRVDSLERELSTEREEVRRSAGDADRLRRNWRAVVAVIAAAAVVLVFFGFRMQRYVDARLGDAAARVAAAERQVGLTAENSSRQVAASRSEAERQIAEAREVARQARLASAVSLAPDVLRIYLVPTDASATGAAQLLWARSTGLVISASRLPAPPSGTAYQIWLLSNGTPIAAGLFLPDQNGRATTAFENPPDLPRPITGAMVTLEPAAGSPSPSGTLVLTRAAPQQ